MTNEISERISQRRRQVLVHSIIYYKYNDSIISDSKWTEFAKELLDLQNQYPEIAANCVYHDDFIDFDCSSGYDLPLDDPYANSIAQRLLNSINRKEKL